MRTPDETRGMAKKLTTMGYEAFSVSTAAEGRAHECRFYTLTTGISPRHSDTVDVKFLVNGKGMVIALAHPAFALYQQRMGCGLTDADAVQMAGLFLKNLLERGERVEDPFVQLTTEQTLELASQIHSGVPR